MLRPLHGNCAAKVGKGCHASANGGFANSHDVGCRCETTAIAGAHAKLRDAGGVHANSAYFCGAAANLANPCGGFAELTVTN